MTESKMNSDTHLDAIRAIVRGAYDLQRLRIQMGNRLVANLYSKLGVTPGEALEEQEEETRNEIKDIKKSYELIGTAAANDTNRINPKNFKGDALIASYTEFVLARGYFELEKTEKKQFEALGHALKEIPIYTEFLSKVRGVGPAMAGVIISEIDIHKARYVSSIYRYAGLDCGEDGKGRSKRKEHLVTVKYTDRDGKEATRNSITFNPFLKTKLIGVLGSSFLRSGSPYAQVYKDYKFRLENHATYKDTTKLHRHNMSMRYMIKMFLLDLYREWRKLEGLEVFVPYAEAKLGMAPHKGLEQAA